jgi:hypothetical protein
VDAGMTIAFSYSIEKACTEIRLRRDDAAVPVDDWAVEVPSALFPGVDLAQRLIAVGSAVAAGDVLCVEHHAIAGLTPWEAAALGLPPATRLRAVVESSGPITSRDYRIDLKWQRPTGQAVIGVERVGAWLSVGGEWQRLPTTLFAIAEAVDGFAAAPAADVAARMSALAGLRKVLLPAEAEGTARALGLIGRMTIVEADAFSLDLQGEGEALRLIPVLHRAGAAAAEPLLPPEKQRAFGEEQFLRFRTFRSVYTLGNGWYVVLSPPLQRALAEVHRLATAPAETRRAFAAAPRAFLREALGQDVDPTVIEQLFQETPAWSERVIGLGLWQKRALPWVPQQPTDWFDKAESGDNNGKPESPVPGIEVGGRRVPLAREEIIELQRRVMAAMGEGKPQVECELSGQRITLPANLETLRVLQKAEAALQPPPAGAVGNRQQQVVLLIKPNEEELQIESAVVLERPAPPASLPAALKTAPKTHQAEGIAWLQQAWTKGLPGVLLADDMGLGKTLQGLAFLAWLREGMQAGTIEPAPVMIVAPTGLLENWRAEHDRHLHSPGLGRCLPAYGAGLAAIRRREANGRPALDVEQLRRAEWVLTTYETLRDYDRDFGQVRFAALLFDEAQKIKTPGVRLTDAAKAMQAEFRVALTGTPVENRLADLWCIMDTVYPGYLRDLKSFSRRFEAAIDIDSLRRLRESLDRPRAGWPALLLRRLREDHLPDLPPHEVVLLRQPMPPAQLQAYEAALDDARQSTRRGGVLEALQRLRAICLHPHPQAAEEDEVFLAASARLCAAIAALDAIAAQNERALLFVDDLAIQGRLANLLQRRYRLPAPPMVINGTVEGKTRQARVDRFQASGSGFDVMLLSPRAGGVGLTLTRANHVIHLSRWWNPAVEDQCTGRVLRIGQERPVRIHIPMAVLPDGRRSFDENLHELLARKRRLMREALLPPEPTLAEGEELLKHTLKGEGY